MERFQDAIIFLCRLGKGIYISACTCRLDSVSSNVRDMSPVLGSGVAGEPAGVAGRTGLRLPQTSRLGRRLTRCFKRGARTGLLASGAIREVPVARREPDGVKRLAGTKKKL